MQRMRRRFAFLEQHAHARLRVDVGMHARSHADVGHAAIAQHFVEHRRDVAHANALAHHQLRHVDVDVLGDVGRQALDLDLAAHELEDATLLLDALRLAPHVERDRHLDGTVHRDAIEVGVEHLVGELTGRNPFSDATNGLFLAAPRRTGKSTFLQNELRPALERSGRVVVYVDLWSDKGRNPGTLISDAVAAELQKHLGLVAKAAKAAGVGEINLSGWMRIDTTKIGKIDGATLTDALRALCEASGKPLALILRETGGVPS